ncbi:MULTISPECIES: hypothetical protein [Pseudomonas]|uniref:hypothetical protein n=1 Tax=Pseudomonas TaxID=286 RepID=UPI0005FCA7D2|nr:MULTISPECIES: hypothetical protein [Pseudomonas]RXU67804.1 hypothetical protein CW358_06880 [Pseudomonas protegens]ULT73393.1 hypothetical protein L1O02_13775 [Pseudomonas sp. BC42]BAQ75107.1 uncharacterized protein POS17_3413 [Pseudomonas sp. Os17]BAQ81407.1 uncharacterized protein PST29_3518 [Pseudomonas sp. St29]
MPRTNRIAKNALSISLLGLLVTSTLALAETQKVTDLLRSGYEIKAAYQSPARVGTVHFLILQKGSSAFQCMSYGSELRPKFYDYSNTYSCAEVQDLIPVQPNLGQ